MSSARRVFVSHIHEEVALATVLRDWVTDAFRGSGVTAFLSSDRQSLPAGSKWLDVVKRNLEGSEVAIAVLSPESLKRPWPNIELGAAWVRDIVVIPFCHSGARSGELPPPFGTFHGVDIDNDDPGRDFLGGVADALKLQHPEKLDFARFKREATAAAAGIRREPAAAAPSPRAADDLPDPQVRILQYAAARLNAGEEEVHMEELAIATSVKPASLKGHAQALHDRRFARIEHYANGNVTLRLLPAGSVWLESRDLMP
jgi:hypothetical protein